MELAEDGRPASIVRDGKRKIVDEVGEVWRIDDEWWRDQIARRYVEVFLHGGERVVVYENQLTGEWFVQR